MNLKNKLKNYYLVVNKTHEIQSGIPICCSGNICTYLALFGLNQKLISSFRTVDRVYYTIY